MIAVPNLDTIDFDELVEEGRGLIPRYAPDWTDHNLHDPGITLLELIAWIVDQQVYRIGSISDAQLAAFAALLGIERRAAAPASGLLLLPAGAVRSGCSLEPGCHIYPLDQPELLFTVATGIRLCAAAISELTARGSGSVSTVRPDNWGRTELPANTGTIEISLDSPLVAPTAEEAPFTLGMNYSAPLPDLGGRAPAIVDCRDGAGAWNRVASNWLESPTGTSGALLFAPSPGGTVTAIRLDVRTGLPRPLVPTRLSLNALPIVQLERLPAIKLGDGVDWPDLELGLELGGRAVPAGQPEVQPLIIRSSPAVGESLLWEEVNDFSGSAAEDAHFRFDRNRGIIAFGNGVNGRAPQRGEQISRDALHVTEGAAGNIAKCLEWAVPGLEGAPSPLRPRNADPVCGGADAWTSSNLVEELHRRARLRQAMLTNQQLSDAALSLKGLAVDQAEVLARFHPSLPHFETPGARTLLVRPKPGIEPTDSWLDAIQSSLAARRVLGERLAVAAVQPVPVDVTASLLVEPGTDSASLARKAESAVRERLTLTRRDSAAGSQPWPSGRAVTAGEIESLLATVAGVVGVSDVALAREGTEPAHISLPLARTEAAVAGLVSLQILVRGG